MKNNIVEKKSIKSYVTREGRLTKSQLHGLDNYWIKYGVEYNPEIINFKKIFKKHAPIILDIGVGAGESTVNHAISHPENNYLAVEVHRPGLGKLLNKIEKDRLTNIKIIRHDVIDILLRSTDHAKPLATDWKDYANHIRELGNVDLGLINLAGNNNFSPRPLWRTETRYELRGKKLDHEVWDLCYGLK